MACCVLPTYLFEACPATVLSSIQALRDKCKDLTKQLALAAGPKSASSRHSASSAARGRTGSSGGGGGTSSFARPAARRSASPAVKPSATRTSTTKTSRPARPTSARSAMSNRSRSAASVTSLGSGNESDSSLGSRHSRGSGSSGGSGRLKPFDPTAYDVSALLLTACVVHSVQAVHCVRPAGILSASAGRNWRTNKRHVSAPSPACWPRTQRHRRAGHVRGQLIAAQLVSLKL